MDELIRALAIGEQGPLSVAIMQLPAAHGDQLGTHAREYACVFERHEAARRECQVDGTAALRRTRARISATFQQPDAPPGAREQQREQRAHRPGADNSQRAFSRACARTRARARARARTRGWRHGATGS
jgi:hypothetical protein